MRKNQKPKITMTSTTGSGNTKKSRTTRLTQPLLRLKPKAATKTMATGNGNTKKSRTMNTLKARAFKLPTFPKIPATLSRTQHRSNPQKHLMKTHHNHFQRRTKRHLMQKKHRLPMILTSAIFTIRKSKRRNRIKIRTALSKPVMTLTLD